MPVQMRIPRLGKHRERDGSGGCSNAPVGIIDHRWTVEANVAGCRVSSSLWLTFLLIKSSGCLIPLFILVNHFFELLTRRSLACSRVRVSMLFAYLSSARRRQKKHRAALLVTHRLPLPRARTKVSFRSTAVRVRPSNDN